MTKADTSKEVELLYYGSIQGYAHTVICSVVVGDSAENPKSDFPTDIKDVNNESKPDEFSIPKQEVRTADMANIDDYQYFKSKKNRTTFESSQLQKLTELMASKIIMAKDINHLRNSVKNTQLFCLSLKKALDRTVTDGENVGNGQGRVYAGLTDNTSDFGKKMQFRTIKGGKNVSVSTNNDEVIINADGGEITSDLCQLDPITAKSYGTCSMYYDDNGDEQNGAYYRFSQFLGIKSRKTGGGDDAFSMLHIFGQGDGVDNGMVNAGRIYKGRRDFFIEMKTGTNTYSGIHIVGHREDESQSGKIIFYNNDPHSRIQIAIDNAEVTLNADDKPDDSLIKRSDDDVYGLRCACGK